MKTSDPVLFDTNVLIYNQDRDNTFYHQAAAQHQKVYTKEIKAVIASQNFFEFVVVMVNPKKIVKPLTMKLAALEVEKYKQSKLFHIIYPNDQTLTVFISLLRKYQIKNPKKIFDLCLMATMLSNNVFSILTTNKNDFQFEEISVIEL